MPSIDTMVYALWLIYLKKLSKEYVQQEHVFFIQWLSVFVELLLKMLIYFIKQSYKIHTLNIFKLLRMTCCQYKPGNFK